MKNKNVLFIFFVFLLAVATKLVVAYYMGNKFTPTLWEYSDIAVNIANGKGFLCTWAIEPIQRFNIQFRSAQEPFFPVLCAVVYYFTKHSAFAVLMIQIACASLIPVIIYYIAKKIYGVKTAIYSSIFAVFAPGILWYSALKLHQMPFYALFFSLSILSALYLFERPSGKRQILLGAVLGVSLLVRSVTIFLAAAIFLWLWLYLAMESKKKIFMLCRIFIIAAIIMAPWVIRNYCLHKRLVLFQTTESCFLYMAVNPNANGTLYMSDGRYQLEGAPKELFGKYDTLTEMQFRDIMKTEARKFIKQDPARIFRLSMRKAYYFWWFSPRYGKAPGYEYSENFIKLYKIYYIPVLFIFLYQCFFVTRNIFSKNDPYLSKEMLILLSLIAITIPHAIFYPEGRHRFALEPLMLIFASRGLLALYEHTAKWIKTRV